MIVYIETNSLMAAAKGQDARALELLARQVEALTVCLPSLCLMEAAGVFEYERKRRREFSEALRAQVKQAQRDSTSANASLLASSLRAAIIQNEDLLNDIQTRLTAALATVAAQDGRVRLIHLDAGTLHRASPEARAAFDSRFFDSTAFATSTFMDNPTDNLILATIVSHANLTPGEVKVLITGNTKDFDTPDVRQQLHHSGVLKQFPNATAFLSWHDSQPA